jgi:hypothetical protein
MKPLKGVVAALAFMALGSCKDFLTGPGLTVDPNNPVTATKGQLLAAVAASQETMEEGAVAKILVTWVQGMSGVARQSLTYQGYTVTESDLSGLFARTYGGGGLVDVREAERKAKAEGDTSFAGIAMTYEALIMGRAASIWGDIPYSESVTNVATPKLDAQEAVYAAVQAKLDTAVAWIGKTGGANIGPAAADLVYGGDRTKWTQAANTLKARYYMHWVEAQRAGGASLAAAGVACGGDCLVKAAAAAAVGLATSANDFRTFHSAASTEWNAWYYFLVVYRAGDMAAGGTLVDTLRARRASTGDKRVQAYFDSVLVGGAFDFRGADRNGLAVPAGSALSVLSATRFAQGYRQPIITAAENALLLAEAQSRMGNDGAALTALNAAKAASAAANAVAVPAAAALTGVALLTEIKMEEWITLFQNQEAWNAYKRNCVPRLVPAGTATDVPGRMPYGLAERNTNPNIPAPATQPARNRNDPKACSDPTHP